MAAVVVAAALAAGAFGLLVTLHNSLVDSRDAIARARLRDIATLIEARAAPAVLTARDDEFAQVVDGSGRIVAASANVVGRPLVAVLDPTDASPQARTVRTDVDGEREPYRIWALRTSSGPEVRVVYVGTSLGTVQDAVETVQGSLLVGLPALLVLSAAGTWWIVGRALRPVEAIRAEVADVTAGDLERRVSVPNSRDEIARLAITMNGMLDRLNAAQRREQQFVADAAHELQSPLAAFRIHLEVALAHPQAADWPLTATELLDDSQRMERLVRDLLFLARHDHSRGGGKDAAIASAPVDLDDVVLAEVARLRPHARVELDTSGVSAAPVCGSREELARLVRNLLENAERYADTAVVVAVRTTATEVRLAMTDDGPGVPAEDRDRIFDRFTRLDGARTRGDGTGLGLAIVREIAQRHGGTVEVVADPMDRAAAPREPTKHGARFVVLLPSPPVDLPGWRQRPSENPEE